MTTSTAPAVSPAAPSFTTLGAALAAVAGRFGWRLWWPLAAWIVAAIVARLSQGVNPADGVLVDTSAAGVLVLAGLVALPTLWWGGARYALLLGHDRRVTFGAATALSLGIPFVLHPFSLLAGIVERRIVGPTGVRVLAVETSDKFGTDAFFGSGTWVLLALYLVPVIAGVVLLVVALMRWNARGLLSVPLMLVALSLIAALLGVVGGSGPVGDAISGVLWVLCWAAPLVAAWLAFRKAAI